MDRAHVDVHEDVALDPGISAVQVENVIGRAGEDVVVELDDRLTQLTIAAGKVNDVLAAAGYAEKAIANDPVPAGLDAARAVQQLEGGAAGGEVTGTDQERAAVQGRVLMGRGQEGRAPSTRWRSLRL